MLQFLRNLGQFFAGPQPHPDKSVPAMSTPHVRISHLVQSSPCSSSPAELLGILAENADMDPHRDQTLRDCLVDEVGHYRGSSGSKGAHEVIVVRFHHDTSDDNGMVHTDRRAAKFERLKQDHEDDYTGCTPRSSAPLVDVTREQLDRTTTENRDRVSFVENPICWLSKYELVASFTPPPGTLNIVDCAAAAHVLTQRAVHYTTLQSMCMWYARLLFETLRRLAGSPPAQSGSAIRDAGKFGRFRVVRTDGRLKLREPDRTLDDAASQVMALLHLRPGPEGSSSDAMLSAFLREFQDSQGSTTIEPLRELEAQVKSVRDHQWDNIGKAAKAAREKSDRLDAAERLATDRLDTAERLQREVGGI
ncbi:hypothetical protein K525DRAFT_199014 [Schizophyllum commune Loenen D]|nr:hypothetical protein K525DRAFT_199014 [Schizophyllum commune Loenen D]